MHIVKELKIRIEVHLMIKEISTAHSHIKKKNLIYAIFNCCSKILLHCKAYTLGTREHQAVNTPNPPQRLPSLKSLTLLPRVRSDNQTSEWPCPFGRILCT